MNVKGQRVQKVWCKLGHFRLECCAKVFVDLVLKERNGNIFNNFSRQCVFLYCGHLKVAGHLHGLGRGPYVVNYAEHLGLWHLF